jgi:hypothetical protein
LRAHEVRMRINSKFTQQLKQMHRSISFYYWYL